MYGGPVKVTTKKDVLDFEIKKKARAKTEVAAAPKKDSVEKTTETEERR